MLVGKKAMGKKAIRGGVSNWADGFEQGMQGWGFAAMYKEPPYQVIGFSFT